MWPFYYLSQVSAQLYTNVQEQGKLEDNVWAGNLCDLLAEFHKVIWVKESSFVTMLDSTRARRTLHNPSSSRLAPHFGLLPVSIASGGVLV